MSELESDFENEDDSNALLPEKKKVVVSSRRCGRLGVLYLGLNMSFLEIRNRPVGFVLGFFSVLIVAFSVALFVSLLSYIPLIFVKVRSFLFNSDVLPL